MKTHRRNRQRGISILSLLILGGILAYLVIIGAKVVPSVQEYMAIEKAVKRAAQDGDSVATVRQSFQRSADAGYITTLSGKDLEVLKVDNKMVVNFQYDKEIPLGGPAYLLIKYRGSSTAGYD